MTPVAQRAAPEEELQMKADGVAQRAAEEEELQMKTDGVAQRAAEEEELQMKKAEGVAQRAAPEEELQMKKAGGVAQLAAEEEELQMKKADGVAQRAAEEEELQMKADTPAAAPRQANNTGMPDNLKSGIENLSGYSMDDVKVHRNSDKPAGLGALAYAQGSDIHLAPGQEQHLPHEAWHVVQQRQGRVQPTMQMAGGVPVNDDTGLEHEADVMGAKALEQR
ncbi:MAG: DUF4157 domain-containing protein, partial [Pseudomonadota bacterium]|nr:DUF4157 domain-containing protein [Pseudomonadota bacterium]